MDVLQIEDADGHVSGKDHCHQNQVTLKICLLLLFVFVFVFTWISITSTCICICIYLDVLKHEDDSNNMSGDENDLNRDPVQRLPFDLRRDESESVL